MPVVGAGGVVITEISAKNSFKRDYKKLTTDLQNLVDNKLRDLLATPRPPGLRFEKLQGYRRPDIFTIHVTGNYKISMEIESSKAILRRVANHDTIDRSP
jgi:mRNA-degrading endonuclease RelE of RelBE toxin-antitoxin system